MPSERPPSGPDGPEPPADEQTTWVQGTPPPPPKEPPSDGRDRKLWLWIGIAAVVVLAIGGGLGAYFATRGGGSTEKIVVPQVVGFNQPAAVSRLQQLGFDTSVSQAYSDSAVNNVIAQKPGAGTQAEKGSVVALTVSKGPSSVAVPNLISLTVGDAVAQLTQLGLQSNVVNVPSSQSAGTVVAQNPGSGTEVDRGSTVRLNVSKGPTTTTTVTTTTSTTATTTTTTAGTTTTGLGAGAGGRRSRVPG